MKSKLNYMYVGLERTVTFKKGRVVSYHLKEPTLVKLNKETVGEIVIPNLLHNSSLFKIKFTVKKNDGWEWVTLNEKFKSEEDARLFI